MKTNRSFTAFIASAWLIGAIALATSYTALSDGLRPYMGSLAPMSACLLDALALTLTGWSTVATAHELPAGAVRWTGHVAVAASVATNAAAAWRAPAPGGTESGAVSALVHAIPPVVLAVVSELSAHHFLAQGRRERARARARTAVAHQVALAASGAPTSERAARAALTHGIDVGALDSAPLLALVDPGAVPPALRALMAVSPGVGHPAMPRSARRRPTPRVDTAPADDQQDAGGTGTAPDTVRASDVERVLSRRQDPEECTTVLPGWVSERLTACQLTGDEWSRLLPRERAARLAHAGFGSSLASAGRVTTALRRAGWA